ncbi:copper radical oxidase [Macrolepiota fuliginosa MF-IS2]|uniref:Copper radical oxidase n=1 Tax=Macrolepiota fuliginosa MF-IS2 TaxID=1400762 RepID=A0A9P5XIK9_9AGAR|nr:copper radical oxidase [Macrolepiota fuliginosa MF-IS2]
MLGLSRSFATVPLALALGWAVSPTLSASAGSFANGGDTGVSAMMMFVGNEEKVYILDKAEGNAQMIAGHPAWGSVWDMNTHQVDLMDVKSNVFCSSGMHLPNGSWVTFGGNSAVGRGGNTQTNNGVPVDWDPVYQDFDGAKAIRVLNPCNSTDNFNDPSCQWFDDATVLAMQRRRWYSAAEALQDGTIIIIGGFVNGGYVNRNYPNTDPEFEGGAADCTYEFYPPRPDPVQTFNFLIKTSGLNAYAHTFLMPSGKLFVQANVSTVLWDYNANAETPLPDMPNGVVRVYPASGAVAMLPLTPANNYTPTVLFCGGSDMPESAYGNYANPAIDTWNYPASKDCQRITPEPQDGSQPTYVADDNMLEGRTMGQFIILPDGKLLVVNGGLNGTAGYSQQTGQTPLFGLMPFGESLASGPVGTPAIYDPDAPQGSRWSNQGFGTSNIARLYHSSAMLLPDTSVLIAGSNPNVDVNTSTIFPTTYQAEIWYPPYFSSTTRPKPSGVPSTISYGGNAFDITVSADSYTGLANDAADKTKVVMIRGGFTTHAMNMGQRYLQLNNTYTVNQDSTITLHVAQAPPNPFIFQPGPAFLYVVINGIPSNGTYVIVGNGQMGTQPQSAASTLPDSVRLDNVKGGGSSGDSSGTGASPNSSGGSKVSTGAIIGGVVAAGAALFLIAGAVIFFLRRKRNGAAGRGTYSRDVAYPTSGGSPYPSATGAAATRSLDPPRGHAMIPSDSSSFIPLNQENKSHAWNASTASFGDPVGMMAYKDDPRASMGTSAYHGYPMEEVSYDPYARNVPEHRQ